MTPEFIGPFEAALAAHAIDYRLVGGKEYYAREEVQALTTVLRAIDNPADRLSVFAALRSPFFGLSDDDVYQFAASGGILNPLAPIGDGVRNGDLVGRVFAILQSLHRRRRMEPPSEVIASLFERTRALPSFRLRPVGDQGVANLWKILEVARAYEAAGPATLRSVVRFLEGEAQAGREEGDSPVGEQAGAQVEVLTVHKAKGLEYPIVIVADLLSSRLPTGDVVVRHATGEGWLKIGAFEPDGWDQALGEEKRQQEAEERRLLYVALTRARDHLVIPCFPDQQRPGWLSGAIGGFAVDGREPPYGARATTVRRDGSSGGAEVTWFDTRELELGQRETPRDRRDRAIDGSDADGRKGLIADEAWDAARKARRRAARAVARRVAAATDLDRAADEPASPAPRSRPQTKGARSWGPRAPNRQPSRPTSDPPPSESSCTRSWPCRDSRAMASPRPGAPSLRSMGWATRTPSPRPSWRPERATFLPSRPPRRPSSSTASCPSPSPWTASSSTARWTWSTGRRGEWTVIDFKTADLTDAQHAIKAHGAQMAVYRQALGRITGKEPRAALCLIRTGHLVSVDL